MANKTRPVERSVADFIAAVPDDVRREDAERLVELLSTKTGEPAVMWGPSIIGFGSYHYKTAAGTEGDMCRIGFSPRKTELVLYLTDGYEGKAEQLARLGKHRIGKSCLYVKRLANIDEAVLEELIDDTLAFMAESYPAQTTPGGTI
jgi:Domain of unknown function (DU1801)